MHCHIPFHVAGGLGVQFVERQDEIVSGNGGFGGLREGCKSWKKWEQGFTSRNGTVLIEGDSGL
jgi:hypothetical protein